MLPGWVGRPIQHTRAVETVLYRGGSFGWHACRMEFLTRLLVTAAATAVAVWLLPGVHLTAVDTSDRLLTLLIVALIFGLINAVVRPVVAFFTGCLVILTLGLFLLVINALMLLLTSWVAGLLNLGFVVDGFWPAFWGGLVISIVGAVLQAIFGTEKTAH